MTERLTVSVTRVVGVCSRCGGDVTLRIRRDLPATERVASCPCGATQIPAAPFDAASQAGK